MKVAGVETPLENLSVLQHNRVAQRIIYLGTVPARLIAAMTQGYNVVPIIPFYKQYSYDFELKLVESYLIKLQYSKRIQK